MRWKRWTLASVGALLLLGAAPVASAKSVKTLEYPFAAVWSTAIRFLRVDRGYPVSDKDKANGYILFTFPGTGSVKQCPASIELISTKDDLGRKQLRLQLNIAHQPRYVEVQLLDALARKLRAERGPPQEPPERKKPKKPAPPKKKQDESSR